LTPPDIDSLQVERADRLQLLEKRQHLATLQLAADQHLATGINSVDLED
jgi:hypothetical protein